MLTRWNHRRGTVYLMVVVTTVIVTTLGLTGLALVRVQRRVSEGAISVIAARSSALSGLEHAAAIMNSQASWRAAAQAAGGSLGEFTLGGSRISASVMDPMDGDLEDSEEDPVDIVVTGIHGDAQQLYGARLTPRHEPLSCLQSGIAAKSGFAVNSGTVLGGAGAAVFSNAYISATSARVRVPVSAVGAISGGTYSGTGGTSATGVAARAFPDQASLFSKYVAIGTRITSAGMSGNRIEQIVMSSAVNPYGTGATNTRGVYWLDCAGQDFTIQNCRIVGTLVLLNCTGRVVVGGSVSWEPAEAGMPILLVQGSIEIQTSLAPLSEASLGRNFNPSTTPYNGTSNSTMTDVYPSSLRGLVYASSQIEITGDVMIDGAIISGGFLFVYGTLSVLYNDAYFYTPPMGFRSETVMTLVPGTFAQLTQ